MVPDSLTRKLDMRTGEAAGGQRYRVIGRWDHGQMDTETWGIYAQQIERLAHALIPRARALREAGPGCAARHRRSSRRPAPDPARPSDSGRG